MKGGAGNFEIEIPDEMKQPNGFFLATPEKVRPSLIISFSDRCLARALTMLVPMLLVPPRNGQGNVAPGKEETVTFTFEPPTMAETNGLDVGQWARATAKVHLRGGFSHPDAPEDPVEVLLEGYIPI